MLVIHRAERADGLVEALRGLLADPLARAQRLSDRLGVCVNVGFPWSLALASQAVAAASGVDADADLWGD